MPHNYEWLSRINSVQREFNAMAQAAKCFQQAASVDPSILEHDVRPRDIAMALTRLEATYTIRLFAEFEAGARQYWAKRKRTHPKMSDLLDALAAIRRISALDLHNAHSVRLYRNSLVHERDDYPEIIPLSIARGSLCRFFSKLPSQW